MAGQCPGFNLQFSHDGQPCVDFKLYPFVAGTNTPKDTFQDIEGDTLHEHPIVLDEQGRIPGLGFFLAETGSYDMVLTDADDVPIRTWANVSAIPPAAEATFLPLAGDVSMEGLFELAGPAEGDLQPPTLGQVEDLISAAVATAVASLTASLEPVGTIKGWVTASVPDKHLQMNGQAVSRTTYPALFALWGTTFGVGDGSTTFNVPAWQGMFLRGYDPAGDIDPDGGARDFTTVQEAATGPHVHSLRALNYQISIDDTPGKVLRADFAASGDVLMEPNSGDGSADETRPVNMPTMWIVRALP